jgi:hypothetical protein
VWSETTCLSVTHSSFGCCSIALADLPTRLLTKQPFLKLSTIDLSASKKLSGDAVVALILAQKGYLNRVILDGVVAMEDSHVKKIVEGCKGLKHLSLAGLVLLTDATLEALITTGTCKQLVTLVVDSCSGMTVQGLGMLLKAAATANSSPRGGDDLNTSGAAGQSRLKVLQARGLSGAVNDYLLHTIADTCPQLSVLDLSRPSAPSSTISAEEQELLDNATAAAAAGGVADDSSDDDDDGRSDSLVTSPSFVALTEAVISRPSSFTDLSALPLHQYQQAETQRRSRSLPPPSQATVTDSGVLKLAFACRGLRVLKLRGYPCVSDSAWKQAVSPSSLPQLEELDLSYCRGVGRKALSAIGKSASLTLRELRLAGCLEVTDKDLGDHLYGTRSSRSRLELLDLHGCKGITKSETFLALAKALAKRDPNDAVDEEEKGMTQVASVAEGTEVEDEDEEEEEELTLDDIESGKIPQKRRRPGASPSSSPVTKDVTPSKRSSLASTGAGLGGRLLELHVGAIPCLRALLKPTIGDVISPTGPVLGPATAAAAGAATAQRREEDPLALLSGILRSNGQVIANSAIAGAGAGAASGSASASAALAILGNADPLAAAGLFPKGLRVVL